MESNRRSTDIDSASGTGHFDITQRNVRDIGEIRTDIAGLKVGMDGLGKEQLAGFANQSDHLHRLSSQLNHMSAPKVYNWAAMGSLAMAVVIVFGGVFGFLLNSQAQSTENALDAVQRESDLRDRLRTTHENNTEQTLTRWQEQLTDKLERQEELNLRFILGTRYGQHPGTGE